MTFIHSEQERHQSTVADVRPKVDFPKLRAGRRILAICSVALMACALPPSVQSKESPPVSELVNPMLSDELAIWLIGPVFQIASRREVKAYLDLVDDEEAVSFIERFWAEREGKVGPEGVAHLEVVAQRRVKADTDYTEGALPGYLSHRGTILILFGEPNSVSESLDSGGNRLEIWNYDSSSKRKGLNGKRPSKSYRFVHLPDTVRLIDQKFEYISTGAYKLLPQQVHRNRSGGQ